MNQRDWIVNREKKPPFPHLHLHKSPQPDYIYSSLMKMTNKTGTLMKAKSQILLQILCFALIPIYLCYYFIPFSCFSTCKDRYNKLKIESWKLKIIYWRKFVHSWLTKKNNLWLKNDLPPINKKRLSHDNHNLHC